MAKSTASTHPNRTAFPAGLSGPALRALDSAGIRSLEDLTRWAETDLAALHGMGPKGIRILRVALLESGRDVLRDGEPVASETVSSVSRGT